MVKSASSTHLVYSTEGGRMCPGCRQPLAQCGCRAAAAQAVPSGDGITRVSRSTLGRGGKTVTVIKGAPLDAAGLNALGKQLKALCGSGGTVKDGVIEIQGDHVDRVMAALQAQGQRVKRAGG